MASSSSSKAFESHAQTPKQDLCRIAVLGSNSFSGSDFIDLLLSDKRNQVLGISRSAQKGRVFLPYLKRDLSGFRFVQADLNKDMDMIRRELDGFEPHYIVNFAAQSEVAPSWAHPEHWMQTNAVSLSLLINHLKQAHYLRRYVHISSPEVYGTCTGNVLEDAPLDPSTPYAASKAAADLLLNAYHKSFDFQVVTVRATNVYGPHQQLFKIIPRSIIYAKQGRTIELHGGGAAVKSYIHIRDISHGELAIMKSGLPGQIYHLSPDRGYAVKEVVQEICHSLGVDFDQATIAVEERLGQDRAYVIDSTKARSALRWAPEISLKQGLDQTVAWVEEFWDEIQLLTLEYVHQP